VKLSVIIPNYNDLQGVLTALNSLLALASGTIDIEWLVQDDASPDYNALGVIPPALASVARNNENVGFAMNCNFGASRATGDVLFFLNQDCFGVPEWSRGWDKALVAAFDDEAVGIVGARLLFPDGKIQSVGGLFDAKRQPFHRCLGWSNPLHPQANTPEYVSWVTGAAMAVRRSVWEQLRGFDPVYGRGYWEDVDFAVRAQLIGHKVWYEPRCTLIHTVGSTGGNPDFMKNAQTFREKWESFIEPDVAAIMERFW